MGSVSDEGREYEERLEAAKEAWEAEIVARELEQRTTDNARYFMMNSLQQYGPAISRCVGQARSLFEAGFFGPSLVWSATVLEMIIRFVLVGPLLESIIPGEEIAELITREMTRSGSRKFKELFPHILEHWDVQTGDLCVDDGRKLVPCMKEAFDARNAAVHEGAPVSESEAELGLLCLAAIFPVIKSLGERVGCGGIQSWPEGWDSGHSDG